VIDLIQFAPGGAAVPHAEYLAAHAEMIHRDEWIIDGFGGVAPAWERFAAADTLVHVDLPLLTHYCWVTKRFIKGLLADPPGWPNGSPLWSSTLSSYRVIPLCHRSLTPKYRQLAVDSAASKPRSPLALTRANQVFSAGGRIRIRPRGAPPMTPDEHETADAQAAAQAPESIYIMEPALPVHLKESVAPSLDPDWHAKMLEALAKQLTESNEFYRPLISAAQELRDLRAVRASLIELLRTVHPYKMFSSR
jgi:hypothetical protein